MRKIVSEADLQIGKNIYAKRRLADLSQEQLGAALKPAVRAQQISKFEFGYNRVSATQLVDIAQACKCSVADLLSGVDPLIKQGGGFAEPFTAQEGAMVKHYRQIRNPELQKLVRTMCRALITETANKMSEK